MKYFKTIYDVKNYDFYKKLILLYYKTTKNINLFEGEFLSLKTYGRYLIDYGLKIYDLDNSLWIENNDKGYSPLFLINSDNLLCKKVDYSQNTLKYFIYNLVQYTYSEINFPFEGVPVLSCSKIIVARSNTLIYGYSKDNLAWTASVVALAKYQDYDGIHSGEIKQIYSSKERLIVSVTRGVVCLNVYDGSLLWHVKVENFNPNTLHIINDKVYLSQGIYYAVIDLKTGEKILDTNLGKNIVVNDTTIPMVSSRSDIVHYNNRIWHLDRHEWKYYLFARVPDTGEIIYSKYLCELTAPCHTPRFHEERMYVLDQQGTLHVFELV